MYFLFAIFKEPKPIDFVSVGASESYNIQRVPSLLPTEPCDHDRFSPTSAQKLWSVGANFCRH